MSDRPKDLPPLDANRINEIRDLLTYESSISFQSARAHESMWMLHNFAERWCLPSETTGHHLIHSEAFVDQGEPVASTSEFAPKNTESDPAPEQALRAHITDLLTDVEHFEKCHRYVEGDGTCTCLLGRLDWAVTAETVPAEPAQDGAA